jgi:hypothetical protein
METRALENFNDAMGLLGRMQQEGRIEGFSVALQSPNSDLDGFVTIEGRAAQISALREDEEFQRLTTISTLCVDGVRHIDGYTNEGVASQLTMYTEALEQIPQRA